MTTQEYVTNIVERVRELEGNKYARATVCYDDITGWHTTLSSSFVGGVDNATGSPRLAATTLAEHHKKVVAWCDLYTKR